MASYDEIATLYDSIYAWKDYAGEVRRLRGLLARAGIPTGASLLDVACGTGNHLVHLARHYQVIGLDANPRMLAVARRKLPRVRLIRARMQDFDQPQRFDAILCLFSAIGYARSRAETRRTLHNLARHLVPGGVLIVEPWIEPKRYLPGHVHLMTVNEPELKVARITVGRRRGNRSLMAMHYLVGTTKGVRYFREQHDLTMVPLTDLRRWLMAEGLSVRVLQKGLTGRGLLIGRRPRDRRPRPGARRRA